MLKDRVRDYYLNHNLNCAETILHAANDEYHLELSEEAYKLIGGFGGGMGCGQACGALCAGVAVISKLCIEESAHMSKALKGNSTALVAEFKKEFGSTMCKDIMVKYKKPDVRCLETVELAADILDKVASRLQKTNA